MRTLGDHVYARRAELYTQASKNSSYCVEHLIGTSEGYIHFNNGGKVRYKGNREMVEFIQAMDKAGLETKVF